MTAVKYFQNYIPLLLEQRLLERVADRDPRLAGKLLVGLGDGVGLDMRRNLVIPHLDF